MRHLPPLLAVRAFEAAARHGTFTAAGVELGLTQSAVSYQIKLLEARLESSLFLRRGRRVELTAAGAQVAGRLHAAFDEIDDAFDEFRGQDGKVLIISSTTTFATIWLARHLDDFQTEKPKLEIRVDATDRVVDFAAEDIDVAIRAGRGGWPGLYARHLIDIDFTPMCSPGLVAGSRLPLDPEAAFTMPRINPQDPLWRSWFPQNAADGRNPHPGVRISLDSQAATAQAAMAGRGLALLTPALWRAEMAESRLVRPFEKIATEATGYWLVCAHPRRHARKIADFEHWIASALRTPGL